MPHRLFAYGTLVIPEVFERVAGHRWSERGWSPEEFRWFHRASFLADLFGFRPPPEDDHGGVE